MNLKELAEYLSISYERAKTLVRENDDFPCLKLGKKCRYYRPNSVDKWLDRKERETTNKK